MGPSYSEQLANRVRAHVVRMSNRGGTGHVGSCFSVADILAVLYANVMRHEPKNPELRERDRFILSKGHAGSAVYAVLAELGYFPLEKLETHCQDGSDLCGHVSHLGIPGVELSSGSLGHGLNVANGMALAAKLDGETRRVFVVLSDGECDEGSTWEGALFGAQHRLSNLCVIIDYNKIQNIDTVPNVLGLEPFADKWRSFGWEVFEVDGHNHQALTKSLSAPAPSDSKPRCVIAHTTKGKGVSFMENSVLWHYRTPRGEEFNAALRELGVEP